jgi:integrase/recombinase XerD
MSLHVSDWLAFCARHYTARTQELYAAYIKEFDQYLANDGGVFTTKALDAYIDEKLRGGMKKRSINVRLTVIKSYAKWDARTNHVDDPTDSVIHLRQDPPNQRVLSEREYQKVLAVAQGQDRDIIVFLGNTGLRLAEFISLKWANIDPDLKFLSVVGKGVKIRVIPLNDACREILHRQPQDIETAIFAHGSRYRVQRLCKRLAKKAGIPKFGPHSLRHRFATELMRQGVSIYKISKILGHASIAITEQVYIHFCQEDTFGITDCLPN